MEFDFYQKLIESQIFLDWQKDNPSDYLVHFYCQIDNSFELNTDWEIGFYNSEKDKITIFIIGEEISIKPEEEAFKKQGKIDKLELDKIKVNFEESLNEFKKIKEEKYSAQVMLNGFIILQNFQNRLMWNISFALKSMNILNIKIDAENKELISDKAINFIENKAG